MSKTIQAVYEKGVFLPLESPRVEEHQRVVLLVLPEEPGALALSQREALTELAGIGASDCSDTSSFHDRYLYRKG